MKRSEPLTLEHGKLLQPLLQALAKEHDLQFAEYSFANNFLFRREHGYELVNSDPPLIKGFFKSGQPYYIPTVWPISLKTTLCLFPIPDQWVNFFTELELISSRNDSDYLFLTEKLKTLTGGPHLVHRRNLLRQLEKNHTLISKPIKGDEIPLARQLIETWQAAKGDDIENTDYLPCVDALTHFDELQLYGRIVFADGQPAGLIIGEFLTPKTFLVHIIKALHEFKGMTPYLYRDLALNLPDSAEWINLEQDLGLLNLRQSKKSFDPDHIATKWQIKQG